MKSWLVVVITFLFSTGFGQTYMHTGLSKKFDFRITRRETSKPDTSGSQGESEILIEIYTHNNHKLFQKIHFKSEGLYENDFKNYSSERSLTTGKNEDVKIEDGDYGDIVVADFNFDGRDDFAVKKYWTLDAGVTYNFYIQTDHGFKHDEFLSDKADFFPHILNVKKHLSITAVHISGGTTIHQFHYNVTTKKWRLTSDRHIYHNKNPNNILKQLEK